MLFLLFLQGDVMKLLLGVLTAFLLVVLGTTADAQAQTYYLSNYSSVATTATIQTVPCGPIGPILIPAGATIAVPVPVACTVTGILYRFVFYPVGFGGALPPPTPPNQLQVAPGRAVFF